MTTNAKRTSEGYAPADIARGTNLVARSGYCEMNPGREYRFISSDALNRRAILLEFIPPTPQRKRWSIQIVVMSRDNFEDGVLSQKITKAQIQSGIPPWLSSIPGVSVEKLRRVLLKKEVSASTAAGSVDRRVDIVNRVLASKDEFLTSKDIDKALKRVIRDVAPSQNPSRVARWVLTYLSCGKERLSLTPMRIANGRWDRDKAKKKLGRPSTLKHEGSSPNLRSNDIERICESFRQLKRLGKKFFRIYISAACEFFGCLTRKGIRGSKRLYHPQGLPFPSLRQYRYHVYKRFGADAVRRELLGAVQVREDADYSLGRFSEDVGNYLELLVADGYNSVEVPRADVEGEIPSNLVVVTGICGASGVGAGIGFCEGSEKGQAYNNMLFSCAIGIKETARLFGVPLPKGFYPPPGLPIEYKKDRGPGGAMQRTSGKQRIRPVQTWAASYQPQSKADVETTHPRNRTLRGAPSYVAVPFSVVALAQRAILRFVERNDRSDASGRMTPEMIEAGVRPTPLAIAEFLCIRGRTDAEPMDISDAVREFLQLTALKLKADGIYLHGQRYTSKSPEFIDFMTRNRARGSAKGFVLSVCVRHIWLDMDGIIEELEAMIPLRDSQQATWVSLSELMARDARRRELQAEAREHAIAHSVEMERLAKEVTGHGLDDGRRIAGKAKKRRRDPS